MVVPMNASFGNQHRLFLQAWLNKRFLSETDAIELYKISCRRFEYNANNADFSEFIQLCNEKLVTLDMELRKMADPVTGEMYWALTNLNGDECAEVATNYTPNELNGFRQILEAIVEADDETYELPSTRAIEDIHSVAKLTRSGMQTLLDRFVKDKWLEARRGGKYSFSLRCLLELETYLRQTFGDNIHDCSLCHTIVTVDTVHCLNCTLRIHKHCATKYFRNIAEDSRKCPGCQAPWKPSNTRHRRFKIKSKKKKNARGEAAENVDEEEGVGSEEEEEEEQATQVQTQEATQEVEMEENAAEEEEEEEEDDEATPRPTRKGKGRLTSQMATSSSSGGESSTRKRRR